ncbi:uncharacterized protein BDZ99DRAFT_576620 [Mytilinidion resinicola]|uniref:Uncharacterized protein n=1 Tax=Mytilinidion resinicola TaxID=574789 RepID=A0A6A6Y3D1_9PEZI|nr:uncharacterized protein BDZ99DRAFT_576620 [Mytilinidion resinicola]KAF2802735.1 hypothetical protein BDZ99DRAFT_576620 [Mytilinidion resinicola]
MSSHTQDDSSTKEPTFADLFKAILLVLVINTLLALMITLNPIIGHLDVAILFNILLLLIAAVFTHFQPEGTTNDGHIADRHEGVDDKKEPVIGRLLYAGLYLTGLNAALNTIRVLHLVPLSLLLVVSTLLIAEIVPYLQSEDAVQHAETFMLDDSAEWELASEIMPKVDIKMYTSKFTSYISSLLIRAELTISFLASKLGSVTSILSCKDGATKRVTGNTGAPHTALYSKTQALKHGAEAHLPSPAPTPTSALPTLPTSTENKQLQPLTKAFAGKINDKAFIEEFRQLLQIPPNATVAQAKQAIKARDNKIIVDRELMKDEETAEKLRLIVVATSFLFQEPLELVSVKKWLHPRPLGPGVTKIGGRRRNRH